MHLIKISLFLKILTSLKLTGEEILILEVHIPMLELSPNRNIGKIWLNLYLSIIGIFAENILTVSIEELFMELIFLGWMWPIKF